MVIVVVLVLNLCCASFLRNTGTLPWVRQHPGLEWVVLLRLMPLFWWVIQSFFYWLVSNISDSPFSIQRDANVTINTASTSRARFTEYMVKPPLGNLLVLLFKAIWCDFRSAVIRLVPRPPHMKYRLWSLFTCDVIYTRVLLASE